MVAIISGDVINSRSENPEKWMPVLEAALKQYSDKFDIFRGDSFQAELLLENALTAAFYIKVAMLALQLDARIGIGIGNKEHDAPHIKNSFGSALTYSGEAFEALKKETVFFIQVGFLSGIGFLLAAKSIFRFGDLTNAKDTKFTEYVLVGTLASFVIGVAIGQGLYLGLKYLG